MFGAFAFQNRLGAYRGIAPIDATLCIIVRNDADRLRRCLRSTARIFACTIVVDTGSKDASPQVARELGAEVLEIEWPGAFDAARNYAFDLVATRWTMYLDSDEWLGEGAAEGLRAATARDDAVGYYLLRRNLYAEGEHDEMRDLRLWLTHPKLRHVGVCHAQLPLDGIEAVANGRRIYDTDIVVWHDGYLGGIPPEKHRRGIELMRRELELRPGQLYYEIELARTLKLLGDPEGQAMVSRLADRLLEVEERDHPPVPVAVALLSSELDTVPDNELRTARTDALIRLIRGWFPDSPIAASAAAKIHIRRGELTHALRALLELERMADSGRYDRSIAFHPSLMKEALWTNLALVAQQLGRRDVARRNYLRLLEAHPGHPVAAQNLRRL